MVTAVLLQMDLMQLLYLQVEFRVLNQSSKVFNLGDADRLDSSVTLGSAGSNGQGDVERSTSPHTLVLIAQNQLLLFWKSLADRRDTQRST